MPLQVVFFFPLEKLSDSVLDFWGDLAGEDDANLSANGSGDLRQA